MYQVPQRYAAWKGGLCAPSFQFSLISVRKLARPVLTPSFNYNVVTMSKRETALLIAKNGDLDTLRTPEEPYTSKTWLLISINRGMNTGATYILKISFLCLTEKPYQAWTILDPENILLVSDGLKENWPEKILKSLRPPTVLSFLIPCIVTYAAQLSLCLEVRIGTVYFVGFIYKASKWIAVYPIKEKAEVFGGCVGFLAVAEQQTGCSAKHHFLRRCMTCDQWLLETSQGLENNFKTYMYIFPSPAQNCWTKKVYLTWNGLRNTTGQECFNGILGKCFCNCSSYSKFRNVNGYISGYYTVWALVRLQAQFILHAYVWLLSLVPNP